MGNTFNESFSSPKKKDAIITQAKDKANQEGKSWSEYIVGLIDADCKKQNQNELQHQNASVISILNNGQQRSMTEFGRRLYANKIAREQQFNWIKRIDNDELIDFTRRNKDTAEMISNRRFNESLEAAERIKSRRMKKVIPHIDKLIDSNYGFTTSSNQDKSIPNELDDIPIAED